MHGNLDGLLMLHITAQPRSSCLLGYKEKYLELVAIEIKQWNLPVPTHTDLKEVSSIQGVGIEGVPLYTEGSSFQGVGIERFYCLQKYPWKLNKGVSLCPNFKELKQVKPLYSNPLK